MKAYLLFSAAFLSLNITLSAQIVPNITIPYIPVQKAQPVPLDLSGVKQEAANESTNNALQLYKQLLDLYQERIANVDLLPLRKKVFTDGVNNLGAQQLMDLKSSPYAYLGNNSYCGNLFRKRMNELFDATLIQSYKEEYRRVREWEMYLREKNLLDASYKNGTQPTGLTNRQAISALYGVDQVLFDKVGWK